MQSNPAQYGLNPNDVPPRFITTCSAQTFSTIDLYEYKITSIPYEEAAFESELNKLGLEGWDLVQYEVKSGPNYESKRFEIHAVVTLKRRIVKDLLSPANWNEQQSRMIARNALRSLPLVDSEEVVTVKEDPADLPEPGDEKENTNAVD
jgi:hypothetical protein